MSASWFAVQPVIFQRWVKFTVSQLQLNRWLAHLFRKTPTQTTTQTEMI